MNFLDLFEGQVKLTMFKKLISQAQEIAQNQNNNLKSAVENWTQSASESAITAKLKANEIIENNWIKIEQAFTGVALPFAEDKLKDDATFTHIVGTLYEMLPIFIRLAITRENFIDFCKDRQNSLLDKVEQYRSLQGSETDEAQHVQLVLNFAPEEEAEIERLNDEVQSKS